MYTTDIIGGSCYTCIEVQGEMYLSFFWEESASTTT